MYLQGLWFDGLTTNGQMDIWVKLSGSKPMRINLIMASLLLASCSGVSRLPSFTPHKMEINQGNLVSPEMRGKLKLGMSRTQVRALLGTPLIADAFHANRWDYAYRLEQNSKRVDQQRMTLYFDGEKLARIDDSHMPPLPAGPVPVIPPVKDIPPVKNIPPSSREPS